MKKRVFVDMDNVLVDFESGLAQVSEEVRHASVPARSNSTGLMKHVGQGIISTVLQQTNLLLLEMLHRWS